MANKCYNIFKLHLSPNVGQFFLAVVSTCPSFDQVSVISTTSIPPGTRFADGRKDKSPHLGKKIVIAKVSYSSTDAMIDFFLYSVRFLLVFWQQTIEKGRVIVKTME